MKFHYQLCCLFLVISTSLIFAQKAEDYDKNKDGSWDFKEKLAYYMAKFKPTRGDLDADLDNNLTNEEVQLWVLKQDRTANPNEANETLDANELKGIDYRNRPSSCNRLFLYGGRACSA